MSIDRCCYPGQWIAIYSRQSTERHLSADYKLAGRLYLHTGSMARATAADYCDVHREFRRFV